jgi:DNA polymerase-3 subunit beta
LLSGLELVAVLAGQNNNIIKFSINAETQQLSLSVDARDLGSATESMSAQITGESIDIAFNAKYLMDGLKALSASEIQMQLNEANQPVIFTPLGGIKMTYLVMPVQIRE